MYFQSFRIEVAGFWLIISILLAIVISLLIRLFYKLTFKKDLNLKRLIFFISSILFICFLILMITDEPYSGGRSYILID
jgi:hypothetical protein